MGPATSTPMLNASVTMMASASRRWATSRFRAKRIVATLGPSTLARGRAFPRSASAHLIRCSLVYGAHFIPGLAPRGSDRLAAPSPLAREGAIPMDKPEIFMAPGPTPVPPDVLAAQAAPLVYHRGPGYGTLLREVTDGLKRLFRTENDVLVFTSSGTGGLESAVANLFSRGDRVVVVVAGYFGERFAKIARAYELDVRTVDYEWGEAARPQDIEAAVAEAPTKGVLVQQSETSTAVIHDIQAIGAVTKKAGVLLVVDCVS